MPGSVGAARTAGAAGADQSYPREGHADQPHHYGNDCPGAPGTGAQPTSEYVQMQHSVGYDDQPHRHGHDGSVSPAIADTTAGVDQSRPAVMPETLAAEFPVAA